jgi:hypothetical protein
MREERGRNGLLSKKLYRCVIRCKIGLCGNRFSLTALRGGRIWGFLHSGLGGQES